MARSDLAATVVSYHARDFFELRLGEKLARSVEAPIITSKIARLHAPPSLRPWSRTTLEISSSFGSGKSSHVQSNDASSLERGFYKKVDRWIERTSLRPWSRTTLEISSSFGSGKSSHVPSKPRASIGSSSDGPIGPRCDRGLVPR